MTDALETSLSSGVVLRVAAADVFSVNISCQVNNKESVLGLYGLISINHALSCSTEA